MPDLQYKLAIVTNASQAFAAAAATALAQNGATVLLTDSDDAAGEAVAAALRGAGLSAAYHHLDSQDELDWAALVDHTMRTHGHLDVLVNQHNASLPATIEIATAAQLREVLEAGLIAPYLGMKSVIPAMRQSGGGAIINIVANPIAEILPLNALYSAAKAGLAALTRSTAAHCAQRSYDIRVNALRPGTHETAPLRDAALRSAAGPEVSAGFRALLGSLAAGRAAPAQDFATAIAWLAGDDSRDVTGTELFCAGPLTAAALALA